MKQLTAGIFSRVEAVPGCCLMWLEAPEIAAAAGPGQFLMVRCGGDTMLRRPISVYRVDGKRLALLVAAAGRGTQWLSRLRAGDSLDVLGPLGNGFTVRPEADNLLLVAGGVGLAPLRFLADSAIRAGKKVTLIMGAKTRDHLPPVKIDQSYYNSGGYAANINVINATEDGSEGFKGLATALIPGYIESADQVFACGPTPMYRAMAAMPELKGRDVQVSLEIMMGCGTGICYGCTIKTKNGLKQVCRDGPVFTLAELEGLDWNTLGR